MSEDRRLRAERSIEQHLFRRVGKVVSAAYYVRDTHIYIVHHSGQLIGGQHIPGCCISLGTQEYEILNLLVFYFAVPENRVFKVSRSFERNAKAYGGLLVGGRCFAVAAAAAHNSSPARFRLFIIGIAFGCIAARITLRRAITQIRRAAGQKLFGRRTVAFEALRLVKGPFIPIESEPSQTVKNAVHQLGTISLGVRVLNAQDELAP